MNRTWLARIGVALLVTAALVTVAGIAYRVGDRDGLDGVGREIVVGDDGTRTVVVDGFRGGWGGGPGFGFLLFPLIVVGLILLFRSRRPQWGNGPRREEDLRDWHRRQHVADVPVPAGPPIGPTPPAGDVPPAPGA